MVIPNGTHSSKNLRYRKFCVKCEEPKTYHPCRQCTPQLSSSGFSSTFGRLETVFSLSNVDDEIKHPYSSLYTEDQIEDDDVNECFLQRNYKENTFLVPQYEPNASNKENVYDQSTATLQEGYSRPSDEILAHLYSKVDTFNFNKENKIIVNSALIEKNKIEKSSSQKERQLPPNTHPLQQKGPKINSEKSARIYDRNEANPINSHHENEKKTLDDSANTKKNTFSVINDENDKSYDAQFPRHLRSSYTRQEYKTTSFFDDFIESHPSFCSYLNSSMEHRKFGCNTDCLGTRIDDILKLPIDELYSRTPMNGASMFDPHVCYMEPKCSVTCQGIPNRRQRYGVIRQEPKSIPLYNPESNVFNSCCASNWDSDLMNLKEINCCRRRPVQTRLFEDAGLYQRRPEFFNSNKATNENELRKLFKSDTQDSIPYQREPRGFHSEKTVVEEPPIIKATDDQSYYEQSPSKKKKHFTCCNSGKVDEHELSDHPKQTIEEVNNLQRISENKQYATPMESTYQEQVPPNLTNNFRADNRFDCNLDCPMIMQPEREYNLIYKPPQQITKSVGCEFDHTNNIPRNIDNTMDLGRNITIQIIPNCCQKISSDHYNTPVVTRPNVEPKGVSPQTNCCQEITCERQRSDFLTDEGCRKVAYMPYTSNERNGDKGQTQYRKYDSKNNSCKWWGCNWRRKKPQTPAYDRDPSFVRKNDCCTTTCQDVDEVAAYDCRMVEIQNCQRVLPIKNNYTNRDGNLLKSLHRLNRGLLKDLFATPCASTSLTCQNSCLQKIRGAPFPLCAGSKTSCPVAKPFTSNQYSQYDPCNSESGRVCNSQQDVLFECLRYLKKGMLNDQPHCEYLDEDCCCHCRESYNNCCCCCHKMPRRYEFKETIQPKIEKKESKSCCTRCRSVEAKQSLRHCGTVVSSHCFTRVETVCTNTEVRPKTPEVNKKRKYCRRRCCCCCNNTRNCCCCCERVSCSEPTSCCRHIPTPSCHGEQFIYSCQCETRPMFDRMNLIAGGTKEPSSKEILKKDMKEISKEIIKITTEIIEDSETIGIMNDTTDLHQETSSNTKSSVKYRPQKKDFLLKNLTLNLCNLNGKEYSKFGIPSQPYHWLNEPFLSDKPNEMKEFVDNLLSERIFDPTPCLKPEVIDLGNTQSHEVKLTEDENKMNEENYEGKYQKSAEIKRRYMSPIHEGSVYNEDFNDQPFFNLNKDKTYSSTSETNLDNEMKESKDDNVNEDETTFMKDKHEEYKKLEEKREFNGEKDAQKKVKQVTNNKNPRKIITKSISSESSNQIIFKTSSSPASSNISKTSSNIIRYSPKPFTTKTGLFSVIPSFRDDYRRTPQVKKGYSKTVIPTYVNSKLLRKKNGDKKEEPIEEVKHSKDKNNIISRNGIEKTNKIVKEHVDSMQDIASQKSRGPECQSMNHIESEEPKISEKQIENDERIDGANASINLLFANKLHDFCENNLEAQTFPAIENTILSLK